MAEVIKMPRLSDTMTEGVIASWQKNIGDSVKKGDVLAEIETDKATMELESYKDGVLLHQGAKTGEKVAVDELLAILGKDGEDISGLLNGNSENGNQEKPKQKEEKEEKEGKEEKPAEKAEEKKESAPSKSSSTLDLKSIPEVVLMPRLSDTMTEGVIADWQKKVGDTVKKGDVLADIETDKATMELESYKDGVLLHQGANAGEKIQVNDLLAIIGAKDFDINPILEAAKSGGGGGEVASDKAEAPKEEKNEESKPKETAQKEGASEQEIVNEGRIFASPLAKKLAQEKGIELKYVKGSGENGRITKVDIDNYKKPATAAAVPTPPATTTKETPAVAPFVPGGAGEGHKDISNSQIRNVIAKRLGESKFTAPHFYLKMEVNMDNAMKARTAMNEISPVKISFNDFVIKAAAMALKKHPAVNASWMGEFIRQYDHVHIGMAVAIPDGLIVPVIRFADQKTLSQISAEAKELGGKAKAKKLQPNEFSGNTFTISNLGMMDIDEFTAIINPPDSAILAVGKIKEEVYRKSNGEFDVKNVMKLTLSCDHRSVDGAVGAAFLQSLKAYLENPVTMLV